MPRLALLVLATSAFLAPGAASADETDCEGLGRTTGAYTAFDLPTAMVPPPLRPFAYDCATRPADDVDIDNQYVLVYADGTLGQYVEMIRSFQNAGWITAPVVSYLDADGERETAQVDADGLAALGPDLQWATARFSNDATGRNIISMTFTDGVNTQNDPSITGPSIYIDVFVNEDLDATGFGDPSVLSNLKTVQDAAITPAQGTVLAGTAVMLTLIVGYPGSLLGSVLSARYDRLAAAVRARWRRNAGAPDQPRRRMPGWLIWPGFLAAAVLGGFVDPAFGPNWMSVRVLLSGLLGFAVFNLGVWTLVKAVMRRVQPDATPYIKFRWGSLVIIAIAVVLARLLEFNPGVIFGLVAGLAFGMTLAASRNALVILLGSGFGLVAAALAWVGYSLLAPLGSGNAALVFATEFLSGITLEGISTLPLALLPLARLDGATLIRWKKWVWALAYAVGIAAFTFVLFAVPGSWAEIPGDFVRWIVLFVVFGVVSVAVWAVDAVLARRKVQRGDVEEESETELQR